MERPPGSFFVTFVIELPCDPHGSRIHFYDGFQLAVVALNPFQIGFDDFFGGGFARFHGSLHAADIQLHDPFLDIQRIFHLSSPPGFK